MTATVIPFPPTLPVPPSGAAMTVGTPVDLGGGLTAEVVLRGVRPGMRTEPVAAVVSAGLAAMAAAREAQGR